ncbi:MAG: putative glycoside hydrolase [Bacillota bacterium]
MKHDIRKLMLFLSILTFAFMMSVDAQKPENIKETISVMEDYLEQASPDWSIMKKEATVKGIYMTAHTVADKGRFSKLIDAVDKTELNAVVIDVKNDEGIVTYSSNISDVKFAGANDKIIIKDIKAVINELNQKGIYPIARIVTFKDKKAAGMFANLAVKSRGGSIWRDRNGMAWLNPYNKEAWDYVLKVAEEAAVLGFKEIQFDYVRFPTDGNLKIIDYGSIAKEKTKEEAIADFLAYARKRLSGMGAVVSADVFGLVTTAQDGMSIGQHLESIAVSIDVICPMVYPSHYGSGVYGVAEPDFEPYKIVNYSMSVAFERIKNIDYDGKKAKLRPWLQDFTATYLPRYNKYDADDIRAQIQATYDAGVKEWILWNASNRYTIGALGE